MAKISDFIKQSGEFLKPANVKDGSSAVIIGEAEIVHNDKFDSDRLHIPIEMDKKEYTFDASKTNARIISTKLGEDTAKWIGKVIVFERYKTKTQSGQMTDALNVKEVK
jgi:hypothetical protein